MKRKKKEHHVSRSEIGYSVKKLISASACSSVALSRFLLSSRMECARTNRFAGLRRDSRVIDIGPTWTDRHRLGPDFFSLVA